MFKTTGLVELLDQYSEAEMGLAQALDNFVTRHVEPFYLDQAANDGRRLAELRHTLFGAPAPGTSALEDRVTFAELRAAMPFDAIAFRAFWRVMGMLAKPDDVYTDPDVVTHTQDVLRSLDTAPVMTRPTHAEPVGRYAIRFVWNDGHELGIYSWPFLREHCPCDICRAARQK